MKRIILILFLVFFMAQAATCLAFEIVILQSSRAPHYEEGVEGFLSSAVEVVASQGAKRALPDTVTTYYLDGSVTGSELRQQIIDNRPDLLLAVGNKALGEALKLDEVPTVFLLVAGGGELVEDRPNLTGVKMVISPTRQLESFKAALPSIKRLGLVYDPERSAMFVKEAGRVALLHGIELVSEEVQRAQQVPERLAGMNGRIDAFWMLPDPTVITPNTVEAMLHFSIDNRIPLLTFAEKYIAMGATAAATFDIYDMGVQAGRLARKVLAKPGQAIPAELPARLNLRVNNKVAAKIGVMVDTAALRY
ncbi:MAG: hypothetical protein KAS94_14100 [Desulfobulbaceae bacterium]|nr:hypothetical protein [Desulfobulbaceae bacterium]